MWVEKMKISVYHPMKWRMFTRCLSTVSSLEGSTCKIQCRDGGGSTEGRGRVREGEQREGGWGGRVNRGKGEGEGGKGREGSGGKGEGGKGGKGRGREGSGGERSGAEGSQGERRGAEAEGSGAEGSGSEGRCSRKCTKCIAQLPQCKRENYPSAR